MMDMGQITQGLRADVLQQAAGQGINVAQMMEAGVSFADIMLMIVNNSQSIANGQGIPNIPAMNQEQSTGQLNSQMGNNMINQNEMSFIPDMKNLIPNMINIQNPSDTVEILDVQNLIEISEVTDISNQQVAMELSVDMQQTVVEIPTNQSDMTENFDFSQNPNTNEMSETLNQPVNVENVEAMEKPVVTEKAETTEKPVVIEKTETTEKPIVTEKTETTEKPVVTEKLETTEKPVVTEKAESTEKPVVTEKSETTEKIVVTEKVETAEKPVITENAETTEKPVITEKLETTEKPVVTEKSETTEKPVVTEKSETTEKPVVTEKSETTEKTVVTENAETQSALNVQNSVDVKNQTESIGNIWQMTKNVKFESKPLEAFDFSQIHNNISHTNQPMTELQMSQKLTEILDVISPELLQTSESLSINTNNSFVMDLLSELGTEPEIKDSFDFSDSMVKIDPSHIAGLFDFISTGGIIPNFSDISGNEMFKNLENIENVQSSVGKMTFDPAEMIKSGEMEVVSYIPAQKNADSSTSQQNSQQTDESTIDLARTMKSVKENVKTDTKEDTTLFSEVSVSMTATNVNPDELAVRKDITFERAYAELEMNKAKYGSADEQLYKGISENLENGKSEFTVKLRPEGLGEILVKLVSDDAGKSVLTMIASSEKTAELLNRDIATLQTSLNQHNVEIENNSVKTAETVMHAETAFDQYNERQQDEANQQHHFRKLKNKLGKISDRNVSIESELEAINTIADNSELNITI